MAGLSLATLVALANAGTLPQGQTPLGVAKMLARESKATSGDAVVLMSASVVDLFAEAPAEKRESDALPDAPQWIELIPAPLPEADDGHVETRDWRAGFLCDPKKIVDAFNSKPEHRRASPIDWEHRGHRMWLIVERNPAAAWIEELRVGDDGKSVWGRIVWTPEGRDDVKYKRYRYISPVVAILWPADSEGNVDWDATPIATELIDAGLTNNPATYIRDLARTDADSEEDEMENSMAGAGALAASVAPPRQSMGGRFEDDEDEMKFSTELLTKLGLTEDATQEQVEQAMLASLSEPSTVHTEDPKPTPASAQLFTRGDMIAAVNAAVESAVAPLKSQVEDLGKDKAATTSELLSTQVNGIVDSAVASFRATPAMREHLVEMGMALGVEKLRAHVDALPSLEHLSQQAGKGPIGEQSAAPQLTKQELAICKQLEISPEDYAAKRDRNINSDEDAA